MKRRSEDTKKKAVWTDEDDEALVNAVIKDQKDRAAQEDAEDDEDWDEIAKSVPGKTPVQCLKRYLALDTKKKQATEPAAAPPPAGTQMSSSFASASASTADDSKHSPSLKTEAKHSEKTSEVEEGDDESGEKASKVPRIETIDGSPFWPHDETDLLKKLVEQYKDSKCDVPHVFFPSFCARSLCF